MERNSQTEKPAGAKASPREEKSSGAETSPGTVPGVTASVTASREKGRLLVVFSGAWSLEAPIPPEAAGVRRGVADPETRSLSLVCRDLGDWDSSLLALVCDCVRAAKDRGIPVETDLPEDLGRLVKLAFAVDRKEGSGRERKNEGFLTWLGGSVLALPEKVEDFLEFLGDLALSTGRFFTGRASLRSRDLFAAMYECGVGSLAIVAVTNLLFGLILAFVGAVQLVNFGAQIYVAGLVGIGMLRVMGAVMVGVVMSGRIGASYAALIGTMQVNEEVDALETMGISPVDFLVLPRVVALSVMVPLLTVIADLMGMVGGFLVGVFILDLSPHQYVNATVNTVSFVHGIVGLVYAAVFGVVIAVFGCYHGMRCARSAQGVGQATTTAVVHSLVGIIVTTAIITIVCNVLGV